MQTPPRHASTWVQASPSSQALPFARVTWTQSPVSFWQAVIRHAVSPAVSHSTTLSRFTSHL